MLFCNLRLYGLVGVYQTLAQIHITITGENGLQYPYTRINSYILHGTGLFTYTYRKFKPNLGKYSIHGVYGIWHQPKTEHFFKSFIIRIHGISTYLHLLQKSTRIHGFIHFITPISRYNFLRRFSTFATLGYISSPPPLLNLDCFSEQSVFFFGSGFYHGRPSITSCYKMGPYQS